MRQLIHRITHLAAALLLCATVAAQSYQTEVEKALSALAADSLDVAEAHLREAMHIQPAAASNAILLRYLGQIQERRGQLDKALESYSLGLQQAPASQELLLNRASLHLRLSDESRALSDYEAVLTANPDLFSKQRLYKQARLDYERLIRLDPMHEKARLGLALLNNKDNRPREAMEQMNLLVQVFPTHAANYAVRAGMEQERRQYELARHDYDKAIELEPGNADYYLSRGAFLLSIKKKKLARADFQKALECGASREDVAALLQQTR